MSTISTLFEQAQLAEAAYAKFASFPNNDVGVFNALKANGFSDAQATAFVNEWSVANQIQNTLSGFSATVFRNKITGQYSLAIRGSTLDQWGLDFAIDAALIIDNGVATTQVVDMYNYWQCLNTPADVTYDAAKVVWLEASQVGLYPASQLMYDAVAESYYTIQFVNSGTLNDVALRTGSDTFQVCPSNLSVDGHSLGGHLAMAFSQLIPSSTNDADYEHCDGYERRAA